MKTYKIFLSILVASFLFAPLLFAKDSNLAAEVLFDFGKTLAEQHRYADAKQELKKCLILSPQHTQARKLLELCETKIIPEKDKVMLVALEGLEKDLQSKTETPVMIPRKEKTLAALKELEKTAEKKETPLLQPKEVTEENTLAPPIQKGAWTLKKGETYVEIYTKYYWHNHKFDNDRKRKRWDYDGKYNEIMTQLKLEYGLTDRDTLLLYIMAKEAHWKDSFKNCTKKGFTEIDPGIKHLLFTDPFICSLQLKIKFPLDYDEHATPALGTHQIDGEIRILTAQPWPKLPGYTKFETGLRLRAEEPSNEIPYFFEFGYNLTPDLILKTTLDGQSAVGAGTKEDWTKYTIGPIFRIGDLFNIEFGFGHTFTGRNTSAAKEILTTLSRQW